MFSYEERQKLNELSLKTYGASSRWQKLLKDPAFKVVTGSRECNNKQRYVQFPRHPKDPRPGTVMRREKAIALGFLKEDKDKKLEPITITTTRTPTFEEIMGAMAQNLDNALLAAMSPEELRQVLASRYANGVVSREISLLKKENDKTYDQDLESLLLSIDEQNRKNLNNMIVEKDKAKGTPLDALEFVTDFIYATSSPDHSVEDLGDIFKKAEETRQKQLKASKNPVVQKKIAEMMSGKKQVVKKTPSSEELEESRKKLKAKRKDERQRRKRGRLNNNKKK